MLNEPLEKAFPELSNSFSLFKELASAKVNGVKNILLLATLTASIELPAHVFVDESSNVMVKEPVSESPLCTNEPLEIAILVDNASGDVFVLPIVPMRPTYPEVRYADEVDT